jgi:hypothetical protein
MISEEIDNESTDPVSAKNKCCICFNHSLPDKNGNRIISPCCPVHYSIHIPPEKKIANTAKDHADWRTPEKKRINRPKMKAFKK